MYVYILSEIKLYYYYYYYKHYFIVTLYYIISYNKYIMNKTNVYCYIIQFIQLSYTSFQTAARTTIRCSECVACDNVVHILRVVTSLVPFF